MSEENNPCLFTYEFQHSVIRYFCEDVVFANQYNSIPANVFSTSHLNIIWKTVKDLFNKYQREINQDQLIIEINQFCMEKKLAPDLIQTFVDEIEAIFSTYIDGKHQFIRDKISEFHEAQNFQIAIKKATELASLGSIEKAYSEIEASRAKTIGNKEGLEFKHLFSLRSKWHEDSKPENKITFGFPSLDRAMSGGMGKKELHVYVGATNAGKTTIAINTGAVNICKGNTVFHASFETDEEMVLKKYAVRLTDMTYSDVARPDTLELYENQLLRFGKDLPIFISSWPPNTETAVVIKRWISKKRSELGVSPDLIIVDYDDPLTGDTLIPMLDGTERRIDSLVNEKEFWLYACKEDGEVVPGKGHSARIARYTDELIEITLDNGKTIKSTPNHNHMLRDGTFKRADEFAIGDSLMPLYRRVENLGYEKVKCNKTNEFKRTHRLVKEHFNSIPKGFQVHHKNHNKLDNRPENLEVVSKKDHVSEHWDTEFYIKKSNMVKEQWRETDIGSVISNAFTRDWKDPNSKFNSHKKEICKHCNKLLDLPFNQWRSHLQHCKYNPKKIAQIKDREEVKQRHCNRCDTYLDLSFYGLCGHKRNCISNNHKVKSIKRIKLEKPEPVYCLTVEDHHNYALSAGIFTHNCLIPSSGKTGDLHQDGGVIYTDLLGIAKHFDCALLVMAQTDTIGIQKSEQGKRVLKSDIAGSRRKIKDADSVITINFRGEDDKDGYLFADKVRNGQNKVTIDIERDLNRCLMLEKKFNQ